METGIGNGKCPQSVGAEACRQEIAHRASGCDGTANGAHFEARHRCQGGIQDGAESGGAYPGTELGKQIREVAVEDLLGRKPVQLDMDRIRERIQGRVVMVTGAAGSIGSEICRQIAKFRPRAIVGFDEAETPLFHIDREMAKRFPYITFCPEIGSITSRGTLNG